MKGLDASEGDPASRRAALAARGDAELADGLFRLATSHRAFDALSLASAAGLPLGEVIASPFALRAVMMGVESGATSRHRELRHSIDWASSDAVYDAAHDVWERGVLRTGKYQGFVIEAPFAIFDPAYDSKWGPHEMLHRAAGFFFRPGMTRWELYLGARLNELVPVVAFYGPEQVMRLDEVAFDREAAGREPRASVDDARWRTDDEERLRALALRSVPVLREGLAHFDRELEAIDEELATGRRVAVPHPNLNASSDATAYVVGHYPRLSSVSIARVLERWATDDVAAYRDEVEALFDRYLFGELSGRVNESVRDGREVFDLLLRAAHFGPGMAVDLAPLLDSSDPDEVRRRLPVSVGNVKASLILANGSEGWLSLEQLEKGMQQVLPATCALVPELVVRFAGSSQILDRGSLPVRALRFIEGHEEAPVVDLATLEVAISRARRDDAIERLCVPLDDLPDDLADGDVIVSDAFERLDLGHDVLSAHASFNHGGAPMWPEPGEQTLLVVGFEHAVSVLPVSEPLADAFEEGTVELDEESIRELVAAGVIGWRPPKPE